MLKYLVRTVFCLCALGVSLLTGACASRKVLFTSQPSGAVVRVGDQIGITPCFLRIPQGEFYAEYEFATGENRYASVPRTPGVLRRSAAAAGKVSAGILHVAAAPFLLMSYMTGLRARDGDMGIKIEAHGDAAAFTVLAVVVGGVMIGSGFEEAAQYLDEITEFDDPIIHVIFRPKPGR